MYKCRRCRRQYPYRIDVKVVKLPELGWSVVCHKCTSAESRPHPESIRLLIEAI